MSTSIVLSGLPDYQSQIRSLQNELYARNSELQKTLEALRLERKKNDTLESGMKELRKVLNPLYSGLKHIYGELDSISLEESQDGASNPRLEAIWKSWKDRLGGQPAKAIDILLQHGAMNQTQLRIQIGCAAGSIAGIVYQLNKAGLINKNGGKISLKEL